ncbi:MAG: hypothetical protein ACE5I3_05920 [Phycisphaerae bacterium]
MSSDTLDLRYWRFFLAIEADLIVLSRYVQIAMDNRSTYSIELARILLSACSEVDVISKLLCQQIDPEQRAGKITEYQRVILGRFPHLTSMEVLIPRHELALRPWKQWETASPPWWQNYQDVKHTRHEHFPKANLDNTLHAVAGLLCLELYLYGNADGFNRANLDPWTQLFTIERPPPRLVVATSRPHYGLPDDPDPDS